MRERGRGGQKSQGGKKGEGGAHYRIRKVLKLDN